jgi:hypothetical protein
MPKSTPKQDMIKDELEALIEPYRSNSLRQDMIKDELEALIEPYRSNSLRLYEKFYHEFRTCPASKSHHCAYLGGLYDHTHNVIRVSKELWMTYCGIVPGTPCLDEVIYVAFLHDIGKIYEQTREPWRHHIWWVLEIMKDEHIYTTKEIKNAIICHEGSYGPCKNYQPLGLLIHMADMITSNLLED